MSNKRMGGSSVDANVLGVLFADGTYQTTAAGTVGGSNDYLGLTAGQLTSYQPVTNDVHNIVVVATSTTPQIPFTGAQLSINVGYSDSVGPEFQDAFLLISDNLQPESANEAIFAVTTAPMTINTSFVSFGIAGAIPANQWNVNVTRGGAGTAAYGATLTQATTGATAFFYGYVNSGNFAGNMFYNLLTGSQDFSHKWTDAVSGQTFTPQQSSQGQGTFYGPGANLQQFVTGAYGPEMNIPTTEAYLGPQVSGVPNLPSGRIIIPGTAPSTTNNYAWYDVVNGGVFQPTATWVDATTRQAFTYNLHIRIVPL